MKEFILDHCSEVQAPVLDHCSGVQAAILEHSSRDVPLWRAVKVTEVEVAGHITLCSAPLLHAYSPGSPPGKTSTLSEQVFPFNFTAELSPYWHSQGSVF